MVSLPASGMGDRDATNVVTKIGGIFPRWLRAMSIVIHHIWGKILVTTTKQVKTRRDPASRLSFLGAVILATFLGAVVVVTGSSNSRAMSTTGNEILTAVAVAGFQGSMVATVAAVLMWFPTYRHISKKMRLALQFPVMMVCGAATAIPVAIADIAFNLNPGFTGIWAVYTLFAGIWSASLAWVLVTVVPRRIEKTPYLWWTGVLVLSVGAVVYGIRLFGDSFWS